MHGAFAELVVVAETALAPYPPEVEPRAAAGFLVAYTTAYHALRTAAAVREGEVVLVLGAAGGVGLAAVQVAHDLGARVIAAASTSDKLARCRASGADGLVDYGQGDLRSQLRALAPGGVDVVLDPVGGPLSEQALRSCARGGRFVTLGYASGTIPAIPLNLVLLKAVTVMGFDLRAFTEAEPARALQARDELLALLASGRLRPEVSQAFPLERTAAALRHVADRLAVGKVVIDIP
jgi:NADPH:quinone reductase-like Zn-dependent oxidoreductase